MEKLISKKIKKIIINSDEDTLNKDIEYIKRLKSSLYFFSKLIYINKFIHKFNTDLTNKTYFKKISEKYEEKMKLFDKKSVLLFKDYSEFEFCDKSYEIKILGMLVELEETVNLNSLNISALYENLISSKERKILGQVYTPEYIIDNMLNLVFEDIQIDGKIKILDPSCGGGYFLLGAYRRIDKEFNDDTKHCLKKMKYNKVIEKYMNDYECDISIAIKRYILENMIYGVDVDKFSCFLTKISLCFESNVSDINFNIFQKDFLIDFIPEYKFDVIIGNPPYIGHKNIDSIYRESLKNKYTDVFYDKSDISYCFFKAGKMLLNEKGKICFITSRYFLEAKYADRLRDYIRDNFNILKLLDYNGYTVFKNAGVSPMIIFLENSKNHYEIIDVEKYNNKGELISFNVRQKELDKNGWILLNPEEKRVYEKIISRCNFEIRNIGYIKQGIITGYDEAFIVREEDILKNNLEENLLRKWIKNSNIKDNRVKFDGLYIIYTNLIDNEENYPNTIEYLKKFKNRLLSRRECKSGLRKWYELQWGRDLRLFENNKIIFPYKAKNNNFYYDTDKYLCSADIYTLIVDENIITYDYAVKYLNSSIFEFIFKCNAKKVGEKLYEYYPNKLENMQIFIPKDKCDKILFENDKKYIENYLEKMFNITGKDKIIIKNNIN